ncbi:MAG: response regulator [Myxococcaceae bacterium]
MHWRQSMMASAEAMGLGLLRPVGEPETVLVAEDDEELREEIAAELRSCGLKVIEVEDGFELEDYLAGALIPGARLARPDLIVSEARMPGLGGLGGLEVLRHLQGTESATPFIVIAPNGDAETFEEAEKLGADYVVEKPVNFDDLRLAVFEAEAAYG